MPASSPPLIFVPICYSDRTTTNFGTLDPACTILGCPFHCFAIQVGITVSLALLRHARADFVQELKSQKSLTIYLNPARQLVPGSIAFFN
jgi:hypothetical protein